MGPGTGDFLVRDHGGAQSRQMLRKLLDGKIAVEPVTLDGRRGFRLTGRLYLGRLLRADVLRVVEAGAKAEESPARRWWPQRDAIEPTEFKCDFIGR